MTRSPFYHRLRGNIALAKYSFADIGALAGSAGDYWRQEFGKLVALADIRKVASAEERE